jgi:hypothetical protein
VTYCYICTDKFIYLKDKFIFMVEAQNMNIYLSRNKVLGSFNLGNGYRLVSFS